MDGLIEGRIVHFILDSKVDKNAVDEVVCRPAIIVNAWGGKLEDGKVNLLIFLDGNNDTENKAADFFGVSNYVVWSTSVSYSDNKEQNTWHWPERS